MGEGVVGEGAREKGGREMGGEGGEAKGDPLRRRARGLPREGSGRGQRRADGPR